MHLVLKIFKKYVKILDIYKFLEDCMQVQHFLIGKMRRIRYNCCTAKV